MSMSKKQKEGVKMREREIRWKKMEMLCERAILWTQGGLVVCALSYFMWWS